MANLIKRRAIIAVAATAPAWPALAQGKTGSAVYPVAVPSYEVQFVAMDKGYFKDEGFDFKLIQGGSGVKTREILASRQGDFAMADIIHVLQLNKNGRPTKALITTDQRAPGVRFAIRKDLFDQGIDTVQKAAEWKRPDGKRAIFGVSSLGGTSHLWSHYFTEKLGLADKVTWVGVGNVDTMLGSLKTKQIDALVFAAASGYVAEEAKEWRVLQTMGSVAPDFITHVLFATDKLLKTNPDAAGRFLKGWFETIEWMKANKQKTVEVSAKVLNLEPSVMGRTFDAEIGMFSTDGVFDPKAMAVLKKSFIDMQILEKEPKEAELIDTRFLPVKR